MFNPKIKVNATVSNEQVRKEFKCSLQGGMRRSLKTNSLVLISDHYKSIYDDRWIDGVLHYTGTGQRGDQKLDGTQNKTLFQSATNGVSVHLFEKYGGKGSPYH